MTLPNWKAADYLVDFEDISFTGKVVNAPLIMKVGWVTKYLHEDIFPDAIMAVRNGGELSGLLLSFSIVEYLTGYFVGRNSNAKDFMAFMQKYFPEQYAPYLEAVYTQLRNGLVHNLSLRNPWITSVISFTLKKYSELHLQLRGNKVIFSISHFIEDARRATIMYSYDLIMKPKENEDLVRNFHKRFNKQDGAASRMAKTD